MIISCYCLSATDFELLVLFKYYFFNFNSTLKLFKMLVYFYIVKVYIVIIAFNYTLLFNVEGNCASTVMYSSIIVQ